MKIHNLGNTGSLMDQFIAEIRSKDIQQDRMRFRQNLERVGELISYEISKELKYESINIKTPLGVSEMPVLKRQPVIATILRAGLPFHQGFLNYFDGADNAFIAGYRKYHDDISFEIKIDYITAPDITGRDVIICDPMLATGGSIELAWKALSGYGKPAHIHITAVISSKEGVEYLDSKFPYKNASLWTGAIDDELTVKSYIVPGLGDAGDLAYGPKNP